MRAPAAHAHAPLCSVFSRGAEQDRAWPGQQADRGRHCGGRGPAPAPRMPRNFWRPLPSRKSGAGPPPARPPSPPLPETRGATHASAWAGTLAIPSHALEPLPGRTQAHAGARSSPPSERHQAAANRKFSRWG